MKLPPGYHLVWAGEFGDLQQAKKRLEIIVPISLSLIVRHRSTACSIRCAIVFWHSRALPSPVAGGVLAFYVSGLNFSISAAIGFVSLFGVSVMDGILMITYYNHESAAPQLYAQGRDVPSRLHTDAPPFDDGAFSLHRLFPAAISTGHRKPSTAPARDRNRRGHVGRPVHAAPRSAGVENDISRQRKPTGDLGSNDEDRLRLSFSRR